MHNKIQALFRRAAAKIPTQNLKRLLFGLGGAKIENEAVLHAGAFVGSGCEVGERANIGCDAFLGQNVLVGNGAIVGDGAKLNNLELGANSHIEMRIVCIGARQKQIKIGRHCYIGVGALLDHSSNISIGDFVHIAGPGTALHTHSSVKMALEGVEFDQDRREYGEIKIGDHTWIGGHVTIYPGVTIGDHCVILPNSVVHKDVPPYTMAGGVPMKFIKKTN